MGCQHRHHNESMFEEASQFNEYLSRWDVSAVINMFWMFGLATQFNGDVSNWNVGRVTNMLAMFHGAEMFNRTWCTKSWFESPITGRF